MADFEDYYHHVDVEALPAGYRFKPTHEELVRFYLMKKVANEPLPNVKIPEINVCSDNPKNLAGSHKALMENHWYFFSTRDRKYANGNRPRRDAGDGFWKATGISDPVYVQGIRKAEKRSLVYFMQVPGNPDKKEKTDWLMHEYKLIDSSHQRTSENDMRLDDVVLYKIYKKKNARQGDIVQPEMMPGESSAPPLPLPPFSSDDSNNDLAYGGGDFRPSGHHHASMQNNACSGGECFQFPPALRQQEVSVQPPAPPPFSSYNHLANGGGDPQPPVHHASIQNDAVGYSGECFLFPPVSRPHEESMLPPLPSVVTTDHAYYGGIWLAPLMQPLSAIRPEPGDAMNSVGYYQFAPDQAVMMINNSYGGGGGGPQQQLGGEMEKMLISDPWFESALEAQAVMMMNNSNGRGPQLCQADFSVDELFNFEPDQAVMINNNCAGGDPNGGGPQIGGAEMFRDNPIRNSEQNGVNFSPNDSTAFAPSQNPNIGPVDYAAVPPPQPLAPMMQPLPLTGPAPVAFASAQNPNIGAGDHASVPPPLPQPLAQTMQPPPLAGPAPVQGRVPEDLIWELDNLERRLGL